MFAAIQQNLGRARNEVAFFVRTTVDILDGRVERGLLTAEDAAHVRDVADLVMKAVTTFMEFVGSVHDRFAPGQVPSEVAAAAAKALAELDEEAAGLQGKENATDVIVANIYPGIPHEFDGRNGYVPPQTIATLNRLLDRLEKETLTRKRSIVIESAARGDDQPYQAYRFMAPKLIWDELLDERTRQRLEDVYLDRSGRRQQVESGRMAVALARHLVEKGQAAVRAISGGASEKQILRSLPDGSTEPIR
ncbi:MAG: hypothetical protein ACE148_03380 [Vicinamibacterales bacterium]